MIPNRFHVVLVGGLIILSCGSPEALHRTGGVVGTGGMGGSGLAGTAGVGAAGTSPTGVAGDNGVAGTNAAAGTTPVAGTNGAAGTTPVAGTNGAAGTTPVAGTNGAAGTMAGTNGAAGTMAGTNGAAGTMAGTNGAAGTTAGTNGAAGTTPVAGTNGAAGTMAGTNGAAGTMAGTNGAAGTTPTAGTMGGGNDGGVYTNYCSPVHWTASANTPTNANDFPSNVYDGNAVSRWATGAPQVPGQYLQIDFGGTVSLTQIVLDNSGGNQNDYPRGFDVGVSSNGTAFTSVATGMPAAGAVVTINFAAAQGRYLRITQTGTAGLWWSVDEMRLACSVPGVNADAGLIDPYDPTNWSATASKSAGADTPGKAIDGIANTRWSTGAAQAGGETFTLNLGGVAMVSEMWLDGGGGTDFPNMYKLEVSTNGTTFTQVAMGAGTQLTKIVFTRQNAQYLRVTQTGVSASWWSIYAITIKP